MFDVNDDAKASYRRIEVLTGPGQRWQWSDEEKARILAETRVAGASVSAVARRWQVCPQQVFGWRRQARVGVGVGRQLRSHERFEAAFVPIVTDVAPTSPRAVLPASAAIEVKLAGAVVRVTSGTDAALLTAVLRAVRASASLA